MPSSSKVDDVDLYVGKRMRARRRELGIGQPEMGQMLGGLSYQQIQKYEVGGNRISVSRLYQIARALKVPLGYFFIGLDETDVATFTGEAEENDSDVLQSPEGKKLIAAFRKLEGAALRRKLVELVQAMTTSEPSKAGG